MHTFFIVLDSKPEFPRLRESVPSLLTVPIGTRSLLGFLSGRIQAAGGDRVMVVPTFAPDADYAGAVAHSSPIPTKVVAQNQLATTLAGFEPSDWLAFIDCRYWARGVDSLREMISAAHSYQGASYWVAVGVRSQGTRERVQCDEAGRVRRIQRYYDGVTHPAAASIVIPQAMIPNWAAVDLDVGPLSKVRIDLMMRGVLSRDLPVHTDLVDIADERGLLDLHEHVTMAQVARSLPRGYSRLSRGVFVGRGSLIHSSARIVPPVIIHDGVIVDQDTTLIGPSVIGAGSTIGRGAVVAQSVVARGTTISPSVTVRHRVASGEFAESAGAAASSQQFSHIEDEIGIPTDTDEEWTFAGVRDVSRHRATFLAVKRVVDVLTALFVLISLSPFLAFVALLIKLSSRGPVFFGHEREGRDGKRFRCWKFRTMHMGAHQKQRDLYKYSAVDGPQFKIEDDPRVTRVGWALRQLNIDEIPQFFNVLTGDMSLVGPRPSPFRENQICIPWRRARLSVRPGITGLWQICRHSRSSGDFQQWIAYDILYVRNMSVWLDLKIALATGLTLGGRWSVPYTWMIRKESRYGVTNERAALAM